jgi:hypothetical protein
VFGQLESCQFSQLLKYFGFCETIICGAVSCGKFSLQYGKLVGKYNNINADSTIKHLTNKRESTVYRRKYITTEDEDEETDKFVFNRHTSIDPFHIPKALRRHQTSYEAIQKRGARVMESRVLILYTGGTIGMIKNEDGGLC